MPGLAKLLIGFAAAMLAGWLSHGPLGRGEMFIASLEAQAQAVVRATELPGVTVAFPRDPISRVASLSGPANDLQREGQGDLPGLNQRVLAIRGVAAVKWADTDSSPGGIPLLVETLGLVALAFLLGLGAGRLFFGRTRRTGYL
jgi:hypothetical protein